MTPKEINDPLLRAALEAICETAAVDFKAGLDVDSKGEWLEVLKDLVAMANSGGGVILFGLDDSSNPTGSDVAPILDYDASRIGDKLHKYTGMHFGDFILFSAQRGAAPIAAIRVSASAVPLVFTTPPSGTRSSWVRENTFLCATPVNAYRSGGSSARTPTSAASPAWRLIFTE